MFVLLIQCEPFRSRTGRLMTKGGVFVVCKNLRARKLDVEQLTGDAMPFMGHFGAIDFALRWKPNPWFVKPLRWGIASVNGSRLGDHVVWHEASELKNGKR